MDVYKIILNVYKHKFIYAATINLLVMIYLMCCHYYIVHMLKLLLYAFVIVEAHNNDLRKMIIGVVVVLSLVMFLIGNGLTKIHRWLGDRVYNAIDVPERTLTLIISVRRKPPLRTTCMRVCRQCCHVN